MSDYLTTRNKLDDALNFVMPDGPEWNKIMAAIADLDRARVAEIETQFANASRHLDEATAKLQAVVAGLTPDAGSQVLDRINGALGELTPVAQNVVSLLSGEPATAPLDSDEANVVTMPPEAGAAAPPSAPASPVRELARASTGPHAPAPAGKSAAQMIEEILVREGGFVNHPADRGGATNFGVTQRTLAAWRKHDVSVEDVKSMAIDEAREIYKTNYFLKPKINELPELLQPIVFDMSINHGPGTAVKLLQRALNDSGNACGVDGGIGNKTIACAQAAVNALGATLVNKVIDRRVSFYEGIVARKPSQQVFLKGWLRRASEFRVA